MTITDSARRLALVAVVAMLAALLPISGAFAQDNGGEDPAGDEPEVVSLEAEDADDAVGRSTRISQFTFDSSTEALLGRDDVFADSLASGSLQGGGRPLLLTPSDALDERVVDELNRLGVETVHILGLEEAISADVEQAVQDAGFETNRFGGETRIETAVDIAEAVQGQNAILARGFASEGDATQAFADSLAAGGWAAEDKTPVLLTQTEVLTGSTRDHIAGAGYDTIYVVGGEAAISEDVVTELEELGATVVRVAGDTRFETAVAIANERGYADSSEDPHTVITDGQGGDAWIDGFAIAAYSGLAPAPIVLSNSADTDALPQPTADYLVDETGAGTDGDGTTAAFAQVEDANFTLNEPFPEYVCTPGVVGCDPLVTDEVGATGVTVPPRPGQTTVDPSSVAAGDDITITIPNAGPNAEIVVSGDCIATQTVTTTEDHEGEIVLTATVAANTEAGECEISVTIDGEEQGPFTITVTEAPGNQTVTDLPELVRADLGTTTTDQNATAANPAGTTVVYEFDQPVAAADFADFLVYRADNTRYAGDALVGFTPGSTTVTVRFTDTDLRAASNAEQLTLATVAQGAVTASDGDQNPEGDDAIGTGSSTVGEAGITNAPDLLSVSGFRTASPNTSTAVDFTFDEAAFVQNVNGFQIIRISDGQSFPCTASNSLTTGSGGSIAGGSGTTTITVLCRNAAPGVAAESTTTLNASDFGRGVVDEGAVNDSNTAVTPNANPMQAADISSAGNTVDPDLVLAEFQMDATNSAGTAVDRVIYVFDQSVASPAAGSSTGFNIYGPAGAPARDDGTIVQATGNRVAVDFANGALSAAVGASVDAGTVTSAAAGGTTNEDDEVGVTNTTAQTRTPGVTSGPILTAVVLAENQDATGASVGFRATYSFDEDVDVVNQSLFFLWQADGDRLVAQSCTNPTAEESDNTVTCNFMATGVAVSSSDVREAVLGTVAYGAVSGEGAADLNPEGGEVTSGGNGTPVNP